MNYAAAIRHLKKSDPVMRAIIERFGRCELARESESDEFAALADAIIYQQLAYAAAKTIAQRFRQLYAVNGGGPRMPRPDELLETPAAKLRAAGLSKQKMSYMRDLARKAGDGTLTLGRFSGMTDEQVIENLTQVKGIGRWTAEMFLIFSLGRLDVLPVGDLGVQYGFVHAFKLRKLPKPERMHQLGEKWKPYRTVATWYLWRLRREVTSARKGK